MIHTIQLQQAPAGAAALPVNEIFGPTIQGEGMDIGRSCVFVRVHHCPVKCPGCDTHYTWDGSETGTRVERFRVNEEVVGLLDRYPGTGVVVSGGEPLLYYKDELFRQMIAGWSRRTWVGLETSGFIKQFPLKADEPALLHAFLRAFTSVHLSPKITPCLHGDGWSDAELLVNFPVIFSALRGKRYALKFVVRDVDDLLAVERTLNSGEFVSMEPDTPVYLMPYGVEPEEILAVCRWLAEDPDVSQACHANGWIITPRLHSVLWGKKRGV